MTVDSAVALAKLQLCVSTATDGARLRAECATKWTCGTSATREITEGMETAACGTAAEMLAKINALLFIIPEMAGLRLLHDALSPLPFNLNDGIPAALVRALRHQARANPDRGVLTGILSAQEVLRAVAEGRITIADTSSDYMGQVLALIDDFYEHVVDTSLLYRAQVFLERLIEQQTFPTIQGLALQTLAHLQQHMRARAIPAEPNPFPREPLVLDKPLTWQHKLALAVGGVAAIGVGVAGVAFIVRRTPLPT